MSLLKSIIFLMVFIICGLRISAQTADDLIKRAAEQMNSSKDIVMNIDLVAYDKDNKGKERSEKIGHSYLVRKGITEYKKYEHMKFYMNSDYMIVIDDEKLEMNIMDLKEERYKSDFDKDRMSKYLKDFFIGYTKSRILEENSKQKIIEVVSNEEGIEKACIYINAQSNYLNKVVYFYTAETENYTNEFDKLEVIYSYAALSENDKKYLDVNNYFKKDLKGKIQKNIAYKKYKTYFNQNLIN